MDLRPTNTDSRVTIVNRDLPKLNLSDYDYIVAKVEASMNAKIKPRFWLEDGTCFDIAYWKDPYEVSNVVFDLRPFFGKRLNGAAYISLRSSDGLPTYIKISEISFIKIKN